MKNIIAAIILSLWLFPGSLAAQSIVQTKHNLSVSGPGAIKAKGETEICIFCHAPHNSSPRGPLWNKPDPGRSYKLYASSTTKALPGQPSAPSLMCLSCHDGTIALGNVLSRTRSIEFASGITTLPAGLSNLGTDLSDDHPISFVYDSNLAAADGQLVDPTALDKHIQLRDQKMECTSCHDAHADLYGKFLVATTRYSELCLKCHQTKYWQNSAHKTSTAAWSGTGATPWFHTAYRTVTENACENCHNPHTASGRARLMNFATEEGNCLSCHSGTVAKSNIQQDLNKSFSHDVYRDTGIHDPAEEALVQKRHVECEDCHNPHASNNESGRAPYAMGAIQGVKGIDSSGNPVNSIRYEYELCYRCHADTLNRQGANQQRVVAQDNLRIQFDLSNPSFHPVEGPGRNRNVPSLIAPFSESSTIYCSDCHGSSGQAAAKGPHGSSYRGLLKYRYETSDHTPESYQAYELCYQCHSRSVILGAGAGTAGELHRTHVVDQHTPCSVCHDPHGISNVQGSSTNNSFLINFDLSIVEPSQTAGGNFFENQGIGEKQCYLRCHGVDHPVEKGPAAIIKRRR